jgi:hypothetical protein
MDPALPCSVIHFRGPCFETMPHLFRPPWRLYCNPNLMNQNFPNSNPSSGNEDFYRKSGSLYIHRTIEEKIAAPPSKISKVLAHRMHP